MSDVHSTASAAADKTSRPNKPYPEFPLFPHAAGVWAKKIKGKLHYFAPWADPDGALKKYLEQKDALHSGRKPKPDPAALDIKELVNAFLNAKQALVDAGELSPRSWRDYKDTCDALVSSFGKTRIITDLDADDFATLRKRLSKRYGPVRLGNTIQRIRSVFKFAYDSEMIDRAIRFGPQFKRPTKKTLRLHRAVGGKKLFTREEICKLLDAAGVQLRAMILLGINAGYGNADVAHLPMSAVDLANALIDFPRPKTGINRRSALWPETVDAVKVALEKRPEPKDEEHAGLVFITKRKQAWYTDTPTSPVCKEFAKLLRKLGINGRKGLGFYTLRHTFRTIADEAKDQPAADYIMGHESGHMSTVYRERISDERLKAVVDHVRKWLFGSAN